TDLISKFERIYAQASIGLLLVLRHSLTASANNDSFEGGTTLPNVPITAAVSPTSVPTAHVPQASDSPSTFGNPSPHAEVKQVRSKALKSFSVSFVSPSTMTRSVKPHADIDRKSTRLNS